MRQSNRNAYPPMPPTGERRGGGFLGQLGAVLPDTPFARMAMLVLDALLVALIVANVVACQGDATGNQAQVAAEQAAQQQEQEAAGSSAAAEPVPQGVQSPWTESGYFSTGDDALDSYVKEFCDTHSDANATFDVNAQNVNLIVSTQAGYVERANNQSPWGPDWQVEYAKQFFEAGNSGNCYNSAAATQFILQYFGYSDAEGQPCVVKLQSGNWGDHGLVFVTNKVDGKRCLVDDALGGDGWMLDINAYDYDVRNIAQNATVKGNVDALDDDDNPTPIQPGELTE